MPVPMPVSIHRSTCMSIHMSVHMSIHMFIYMSVHMSTDVYTHVYTHMPISVSTQASLYTCLYMPTCTILAPHYLQNVPEKGTAPSSCMAKPSAPACVHARIPKHAHALPPCMCVRAQMHEYACTRTGGRACGRTPISIDAPPRACPPCACLYSSFCRAIARPSRLPFRTSLERSLKPCSSLPRQRQLQIRSHVG